MTSAPRNPKPSVDPVRWQPPPVATLPEFGPAELTVVPMPGDAPEDIVVDADGALWTGLVDGRIVRIGPDGTVRVVGQTTGRPLGMTVARDGRPRAVIAGGEATVSVPVEHGVGGRNQQTVLAAIDAIERAGTAWPEGLLVASVGTDGEDGPTDAAGAYADDTVVAAIARQQLDLHRALARCDAYPLFAAAGGLIHTGPTGTNVADIRIVLARP